ncbi:MAG TPA: hypothetical protein DCS31_01430, partial [Candidatus Competibacteraceae bacterium]|nr:hypothetical protein [Candidatus Competibacteraceae bacterium]
SWHTVTTTITGSGTLTCALGQVNNDGITFSYVCTATPASGWQLSSYSNCTNNNDGTGTCTVSNLTANSPDQTIGVTFARGPISSNATAVPIDAPWMLVALSSLLGLLVHWGGGGIKLTLKPHRSQGRPPCFT